MVSRGMEIRSTRLLAKSTVKSIITSLRKLLFSSRYSSLSSSSRSGLWSQPSSRILTRLAIKSRSAICCNSSSGERVGEGVGVHSGSCSGGWGVWVGKGVAGAKACIGSCRMEFKYSNTPPAANSRTQRTRMAINRPFFMGLPPSTGMYQKSGAVPLFWPENR